MLFVGGIFRSRQEITCTILAANCTAPYAVISQATFRPFFYNGLQF